MGKPFFISGFSVKLLLLPTDYYRHENPSGLLHIYNKLFSLKLAKFVYDAEVTGLYYTIDGDFRPGSSNFETWQNLRISVHGLNEKLSVLLNEILDQINSFQGRGINFVFMKKVIFTR